MPSSFSLALVVAALASSPVLVRGHGRMTAPAARNGGNNGAVAGGPGTVHAFGSAGEHAKYQHGICGNAAGTVQTWNAVGDLQATYTTGDVIEVEVQITAHHVGYFEVDLCLDAGQLSEECFAEHRLLRSGCECACPGDPSNSCEECKECRWFWKALMQGELSQTVAQGYAGPVLPGGGNLVPYNYKMFYKLPSNVSSSNAVLRWHYMTTNSCTSGASAPEEFWNCADVAIKDLSGSTGPAVSYDNAALQALAVPNLLPAIEDGTLQGVYYACPTDSAGGLLGVGAADEYHCGSAQDPGPYEYCASATGSNAAFDCTGIPSSAINCEAECSAWYYQCANGIAYLKEVAQGTKCKSNTFVPALTCDSAPPAPSPPAPAPTPSPTYAPMAPTTTPPATTAAPTTQPASIPPAGGACVRETDCTKSLWCNDASYDAWCANHAVSACTAVQCRVNGEPVPAPEPTPEPEPEPTPEPSPTPSAGACPSTCSGCLATNQVCYDVDKSWCDARAGIGFAWCGALSLSDTGRALRRSRKHAFLGAALLETASSLSREVPGEL